MQTHFEWWVKSILTFVNKVKMLGFKVRNYLKNAFLSLTNDEHKYRKSLTLLSHSLFPFPIWIFAPKMGIFAIEDSDCKVYETFSYWVLDAMSKIICFFFLQCMSLKPEKNSFTFQNGLQTTTFFSFQFFFVRTANIMRLKKGFFSNWYEHQSSAARRSEHVFNSWWPSRAMKSYTWTSRISAGNF